MKNIQELEIDKSEHEAAAKELGRQISHAELPDRMRESFDRGHGWPEIAQSLLLKKKLGEELYDQLYIKVEKLIEEIVSMVPRYEEVVKECVKCARVKEIVK